MSPFQCLVVLHCTDPVRADIRRTTNVSLNRPDSLESLAYGIEVIEVDAQISNEGLVQWPQGLPPMDGIIICYDSSDKSSYHPVEALLSTQVYISIGSIC